MSQPSGMKYVTCRFCGYRYRLTNWMYRYQVINGTPVDDTHQISCFKRTPEEREAFAQKKELHKP